MTKDQLKPGMICVWSTRTGNEKYHGAKCEICNPLQVYPGGVVSVKVLSVQNELLWHLVGRECGAIIEFLDPVYTADYAQQMDLFND